MVIGASLLLSLLTVGGAAGIGSSQDSFVEQRETEDARSPFPGTFSIEFVGGRRTFHPGEMIALVYSFGRGSVTAHNYEHCPSLGISDAVLDHREGTADPQADLWNNGFFQAECGVLGGAVGGVVDGLAEIGSEPRKPEPQPIRFVVFLNQGVRFDRPGKYRFYVRSRHLFDDSGGPPLISNVLELEIVPRDSVWESLTAAGAAQTLAVSNDFPARVDAARTLGFLGTNRALAEIASRYCDVVSEGRGRTRYDRDLERYWLRGLFGSPNRPAAIARLEEQLARPERYISGRFVRTLVVLEILNRTTARPIGRDAYAREYRRYAMRRAGILNSAGRLVSALKQEFELGATAPNSEALLPVLDQFVGQTTSALASLTPETRGEFLTAQHRVFSKAVFLPMLRALTERDDAVAGGGVALRIVADISPAEGRRRILRELTRQTPRAAITVLGMLEDSTLPSLDDGLAGFLERSSDQPSFQSAIDRIERYATDRIANRVRRVYETSPFSATCAAGPVALAYFFRVDPEYARTRIDRLFDELLEEGRCSDAFWEIGDRRRSAQLEDVAIAYLTGKSDWIIADAAWFLHAHGSSRAKQPLWAAFEVWRNRSRHGPAPPDEIAQDGMLENILRDAIDEAAGWRLTEDERIRLAEICITENCKSTLREHVADHVIQAYSPDWWTRRQSFLVGKYAMRTTEDLHAKLLQFPAGWWFSWTERDDPLRFDIWPRVNRNRVFEETRLFLEQHGMTLTRLQ